MGSRIIAAAAGALALVALTGCAPQTASQDDVRAACEQKVSGAVTAWWSTAYSETPWSVGEVTTMSTKERASTSDDATGFDVTGEAVVRANEDGNVADAVRWSCFAQYRSDDPTTVYAAIRDVTRR